MTVLTYLSLNFYFEPKDGPRFKKKDDRKCSRRDLNPPKRKAQRLESRLQQ